jgi:hypothetical protein
MVSWDAIHNLSFVTNNKKLPEFLQMEYNQRDASIDFAETFISKPKSVGIVLQLGEAKAKEYHENLYENIIPNLNKQTILPHTVYLTKSMFLKHLIRTGIKIKAVSELREENHDLVLTIRDSDKYLDKRFIEDNINFCETEVCVSKSPEETSPTPSPVP